MKWDYLYSTKFMLVFYSIALEHAITKNENIGQKLRREWFEIYFEQYKDEMSKPY